MKSLSRAPLHEILQARVLEWVAISFTRDLPDSGIKPGSPTFQADALTSEPPGKPEGGAKSSDSEYQKQEPAAVRFKPKGRRPCAAHGDV